MNNVERPLFTWSFWCWTLLSPAVISVIITLVSCNSCNDSFLAPFYQFNYWTENAERTVMIWDLLKVPLSILLLSIPIGGLIAANHRAAQAARQIQQANDQMAHTREQSLLAKEERNIALLRSHQDRFFLQLEHLEKSFPIKFYSQFELYKAIFPQNKGSHFSEKGDHEFLLSLRQRLTAPARAILELKISRLDSSLSKLLNTQRSLHISFNNELKDDGSVLIPLSALEVSQQKEASASLRELANTDLKLVGLHEILLRIIHSLCDFSEIEADRVLLRLDELSELQLELQNESSKN